MPCVHLSDFNVNFHKEQLFFEKATTTIEINYLYILGKNAHISATYFNNEYDDFVDLFESN